jgi:DNA-binding transcriptional MerR regulator
MSAGAMSKGPDAFRTISEVAEDLDVPQHVLRFWETRFSPIRPLKRGGGRRYYRPDDVELLKGIRQLLYGQGYTIKGVQRILKEDGLRFVQAVGRGEQVVVPGRRGPDEEDDDSEDLAETATANGHNAMGAVAAGATGREREADQFGAAQAFSPEAIERLRSALDDLLECERVLASLRDR